MDQQLCHIRVHKQRLISLAPFFNCLIQNNDLGDNSVDLRFIVSDAELRLQQGALDVFFVID